MKLFSVIRQKIEIINEFRRKLRHHWKINYHLITTKILLLPSTVQPTDCAVPKISFTTPAKFLDIDLGRMVLAALKISSMVMLPLCLMFLTFLRSRGGSLRALMIKAAALGTTSTLACLFWMVSLTVTFKPFQSWVALAMSSPIFLGDKPRGPTLGAKAEVAATSPPTARRQTIWNKWSLEKCVFKKRLNLPWFHWDQTWEACLISLQIHWKENETV